MKYLLLPLLVLTLVGCASQSVYVHGDLTGPPDFEEMQNFWILGIGQESMIDATPICGAKRGGVSHVRVRQTFSNALVTIVTLGIYAPRTVQVYCKGG